MCSSDLCAPMGAVVFPWSGGASMGAASRSTPSPGATKPTPACPSPREYRSRVRWLFSPSERVPCCGAEGNQATRQRRIAEFGWPPRADRGSPQQIRRVLRIIRGRQRTVRTGLRMNRTGPRTHREPPPPVRGGLRTIRRVLRIVRRGRPVGPERATNQADWSADRPLPSKTRFLSK